MFESFETERLYQRATSSLWDFRSGLRYDSEPDTKLAFAVPERAFKNRLPKKVTKIQTSVCLSHNQLPYTAIKRTGLFVFVHFESLC